MIESLKAIVQGERMGELRYDRSKDLLSFSYAAAWQKQSSSFPLSLSLPLHLKEHPDKVVRPFIQGLLPDNPSILEQWGKRFHVSPRNPFKILWFVGEECAGSVQFVRPERETIWSSDSRPKSIRWLDGRELTQVISALANNHSTSQLVAEGGQFSLAGAQPKIPLRWDPIESRWGIPSGAEPTTHILKPNTSDFQDYDINEHFCLNLARAIGLPAAESRIEQIGDIPVIIVTRFDRIKSGEQMVRIHQEDMCQALGVYPRDKYQNEGGPSAAQIIHLIQNYSNNPHADTLRFINALIFNWIIGGTDAHSKNYGFLIASGSTIRLAPLYDLSSIYPYTENAGQSRKSKLAMKIGGEYHHWKIGPKNWEKAAREWNFDSNLLTEMILKQASDLCHYPTIVADQFQRDGINPNPMLNKLIKEIESFAAATLKLFQN